MSSKVLSLSLVVTLASAAAITSFARADEKPTKGPEYIRDGTTGEYPPNFVVDNAGIQVPALGALETLGPKVTCDLTQGQRITLWGDASSETKTVSYKVGKFKVLKTQTLTLSGPGESLVKVRVKKGEIVKELSYISEGFCDLEVQGTVYEDTCFSVRDQDEKEFKEVQRLDFATYAKIPCGNSVAWVKQDTLENTDGVRAVREDLDEVPGEGSDQ